MTNYVIVNTNQNFDNLSQTALEAAVKTYIFNSNHYKHMQHLPYSKVYAYTVNGEQQYAVLDVHAFKFFTNQAQLDTWLKESEDLLARALAD